MRVLDFKILVFLATAQKWQRSPHYHERFLNKQKGTQKIAEQYQRRSRKAEDSRERKGKEGEGRGRGRGMK
jgi:hypothetical protein